MTYYDILAEFLRIFPRFIEHIRFWWPGSAPHTIVVETAPDQQFTFTYRGENKWSLITAGVGAGGDGFGQTNEEGPGRLCPEL